MVGIFYQKETLNDTLLININGLESKKNVGTNEFFIGYDENDKVCFINIFNFSNYLKIPNGFLEPTRKIIKVVHKVTNINLKDFDLTNKFVYGKVEEAKPIPETHLHKCLVNVNTEKKLNIVCGANNVHDNMVTVVAIDNAILPNGKRIKAGKLMNHISQGMLCSAKELNFPEAKEGIIEVGEKVKIGSPFNGIYVGV